MILTKSAISYNLVSMPDAIAGDIVNLTRSNMGHHNGGSDYIGWAFLSLWAFGHGPLWQRFSNGAKQVKIQTETLPAKQWKCPRSNSLWNSVSNWRQ